MANLALRPLTEQEERLLRWILEHGSDEAKSYLPQIERMQARRSCSCGCPSISLVAPDSARAGIVEKDRILVDLSGRTAKGSTVGVLIFHDEGKLSELEVYSYGDEGSFDLPTIESLSTFQRSEQISPDA
jgi:hypothetical protein